MVTIVNTFPDAHEGDAFVRKGLRILYDIDGDAVEDIRLNFKFGGLKNGTQRIVGKVKMHPDPSMRGRFVKGRTTAFGDAPAILDGDHGIQVFAGAADDPFFADGDFLAGPAVCPPGNDSFAFQNVSSLALAIPIELFGSELVGAWARTKKDQMGRSLVGTLYIPPSKLDPSGDGSLKNAFNNTAPADQPAAFGSVIAEALGVFNDPQTVQELQEFLTPDVLRLRRTEPSKWPNGRSLSDDVVDGHLALLTNGIETRDCVRRNNAVLREDFPHVGGPWGVVGTGILNVRAEPDAQGVLLGTLPGGTEVQLLRRTPDHVWAMVSWAGSTPSS